MRKQPHPALAYGAVFLLALAARLLTLGELSGSPLLEWLISDGARYDAWAREIASGDRLGAEVFYQAPLYPYFLAAVYEVFGAEVMAARLVQAVLGAAGCALLAAAGSVFLSRRAGLAAGVLLALYPPAIVFDLLIQKAGLASFLLISLLAVLALLERRVGWGALLGAGLLLGALALVRENARVLFPLLLAWLLLRHRAEPLGRRAAWAGIFAFGTALALAPVALRNLHVGGELVLTTAQMGPNFYIGNNPEADGTYRALRPGRGNPEFERIDAEELAEAAAGRELTASEVSGYWLSRALDYVRSEPLDWLLLTGRKFLLVWNAEELADAESLGAYRDGSRLLGLFATWLHLGVLMPLAAAGVWVTREDWRRLWLLYASALVLALSVALFFVFARYRFSVVPIVALFAAAGMLAAFDHLRRRRWRPLAALAAVALPVAALANLPLAPGADARALTYNNLGIALSKAGRLEPAITQYRRALEVDPAYAEARYNLGVALQERGDGAGAERELAEAVRLEPGFAAAHGNLGAVLEARGELEAAIAAYRRALELQPAQPAVRFNLGNALLQRGRVEEAVEQYRLALGLDPDDAAVHHNLGVALYQRGAATEAISHLRTALRLDPSYAQAHRSLGIVFANEGRLEEAAAELRAALEVAPDDPAVERQLAQVEAMLAAAGRAPGA